MTGRTQLQPPSDRGWFGLCRISAKIEAVHCLFPKERKKRKGGTKINPHKQDLLSAIGPYHVLATRGLNRLAHTAQGRNELNVYSKKSFRSGVRDYDGGK